MITAGQARKLFPPKPISKELEKVYKEIKLIANKQRFLNIEVGVLSHEDLIHLRYSGGFSLNRVANDTFLQITW